MRHYLQNGLPFVKSGGFYGEFGGAFVTDSLRGNLHELEVAFQRCVDDLSFQREFDMLLHDYVGRPTPLYYSSSLSKLYGGRIYLKREDLNFTGAHKITNAVGQALLARRMDKKRLIAETGAGQHGVATATVAALFGMEAIIFMGGEDILRQRPNVERMRMLGAKVVSVNSGNGTLSNAVDAALHAWSENSESAFYMLGSAVGPHPYPEIVARFQSVISYEMKKQLLSCEGRETPDIVVAAVGGGSNAAGAFYNYIADGNVRLIAVEAGGKGIGTGYTAASLTDGHPMMLHGSRTMVLSDGHGNMMDAYSVSAGLDYPGIGPLHAYLASEGRSEIEVVNDEEAIAAAKLLSRTEGIVPAIESSHALAALAKISIGKDDVVVVNLSGRGDKDMATYADLL